MNKKEIKKILDDGISIQGTDEQFRSMQEEAAELIVAINHWFRGKGDMIKVIEEIVDVKMMCMMLEKILDDPDQFKFMEEKKWKKYKDYLKKLQEQKGGRI